MMRSPMVKSLVAPSSVLVCDEDTNDFTMPLMDFDASETVALVA